MAKSLRSVIDEAIRSSSSIYGDIGAATNAVDTAVRSLISGHLYDTLALCRSERETQSAMDLADRIGRPDAITPSPARW